MATSLDSIFTTRDVATVFDISRQRVQQLATLHQIGRLLRGQRYRLFTRDDIERFAAVRQTIQPRRRKGVRRQSPPTRPDIERCTTRREGEPVEFSPEYWR